MHRSKSTGLTLIEMLIALAVLSLISLAAATALRTFAQSQAAVEKKIEQVEQMRMTLGFVRRSLQKAIPMMHPKGFNAYFEGGSQELVWVSPMSQVGVKGLQLMRLSTNSSGALHLQMIALNDGWQEPDWSGVDVYTIIEDGVELEIAYRESWDQEWQDEWRLSPQSPSTVSLNIQYKDKYWPELIVHLMATRMVQM